MTIKKSYSSQVACSPRRSGTKARGGPTRACDAAFPATSRLGRVPLGVKRKKLQNEPKLKNVQASANQLPMQKTENSPSKNEPNFVIARRLKASKG